VAFAAPFSKGQAEEQTNKPAVTELTCEHRSNPMGLETCHPRLSWKIRSAERNTRQQAYEIRVFTNSAVESTGKGGLIWSSKKIESAESVLVQYNGPALESDTKYYWQVRIWDNHRNASAWSEKNFWQMGILSAGEWKAKWISYRGPADSATRDRPALFRKRFVLRRNVRAATLYVSAHGLYEAHLNGAKIGHDYLTPGWTSYNKRLQYQAYDVLALLNNGANALGVMLGNGWYGGRIGFDNRKGFYGHDHSLIVQLRIKYDDGSQELILSDSSWKASTGAVLSSDIYDGEIYDARLEKVGWTQPNYNMASWQPVTALTLVAPLVATDVEPVRKHESFLPLRFIKTPKGELVADFGQNLVGWVELKVTGPRGRVITLSHAEVLDKAGNFYTTNLRSAKQEIKYILKGSGGNERYEPHFTFQGFRYVKIEGFPGMPTNQNFKAWAVYSDTRQTGAFSCSDRRLNQLQHNITWGERGNFLDVPTDCPQRNERLGWTGDAQVFFNTAAFNRDVSSFFTKWLKDLRADQRRDGAVPFVIPNVLDSVAAGSAGWSDVATIIPWNLYLAYGDKQLLSEQYQSMQQWVGFMHAHATNELWNVGFHFGDWLFYRPDDDNDGRSAVTDKYLIAQAFYAHSTQLLINAAGVLGKASDVERYSLLLDSIKKAFVHEYVTPSGRLVSGSQTAYVLALNFDLLPQDLRGQAVDRLVNNVQNYHYHLTTGFLGTPYLCAVLSRFGQDSIAYKLMLQDTYPSWLYPIKMGATTVWERWDGIKPDSTFETPSMNSFNHYAYGAIGEWMYSTLAGLSPGADSMGAGYRSFRIAPHPGGGLDSAKAQLDTPYGLSEAGWKRTNGQITITAVIPAGTTAKVSLPLAAQKQVTEGVRPLSALQGTNGIKNEGQNVSFVLGSGSYSFTYAYLPIAANNP